MKYGGQFAKFLHGTISANVKRRKNEVKISDEWGFQEVKICANSVDNF
jgi:hypothetical protein